MNRNTESYFSELPDVMLSRSTFDISSDHKFTGNVGKLIPFYLTEVLPGDTMDVQTSKIVRLQTLLTPIMDNIYLDTYWFFVPNRLVWDHWREFMGENTTSAWIQQAEYSIPQIEMRVLGLDPQGSPSAIVPGCVADYMGIPLHTYSASQDTGLFVNALPFRAYWLIWNEFFRDENLQMPANIYTGDANRQLQGSYGFGMDPSLGEQNLWCAPVAKYHDYFTSCLPAPQKGPDVMIPMDTMVPVITSDQMIHPLGVSSSYPGLALSNRGTSYGYQAVQTIDGNSVFVRGGADNSYAVHPVNLWASMDNMQVSTINNLRMAFQIQKLYEKDARGGTRYIEMLRSHFGVVSSDARLQRPEYLGGNRVALNVNQVTNNAQSEQEFLGDLGAFSHTADVHADFVKSFEEHGFLIGVCCVRYEHTYADGVERFWSRKQRLDYYFPVLANIGEQPVYRKEIYCTGFPGTSASDNQVFGYQEAWADYRYKPNRVSALMRPHAPQSLASWNLADDYNEPVVLSPEWIQEDKTNVDRVLAVTSEVSDQILFDIYTRNRATRCMPVHSIPGLADHH